MKTKNLLKNLILPFFILMLITILLLPKENLIVNASFETDVNHKSSVLVEYNTGKVLVNNNSHEKLPIASVTKLMTVLLTLEQIDSGNIKLEEKITVSENASGMGGSQIFLDANCEYEISQLLKSVIVCSANDSSVALAEHIAGSEQNFVKLMNEKANILGMSNTHYANCTGLPSAEGYSSAHDQAIALKQVLSYDLYHEYSGIWMEDFIHPSGRITQMTNTNKLSRFYEGCIGGKTGSTNQAKYCLAVGAERNNTKFIAVVLGAENSKERFKLASDLLNHGFANYESKIIFSNQDLADKSINIKNSDKTITLKPEREYSIICNKNETPNYQLNFHLPNQLKKVEFDEVVGTVEIVVDGVVVDTINILSCENYSEPSIWDNFKEIIKNN
ncbi:MAG: D-alanyl-D-alanine carboxypeptidase [Clostridia bacterium]|nr:D-alanyl-D-alanine carboxypeptidase [Clostridia bacterium]